MTEVELNDEEIKEESIELIKRSKKFLLFAENEDGDGIVGYSLKTCINFKIQVFYLLEDDITGKATN